MGNVGFTLIDGASEFHKKYVELTRKESTARVMATVVSGLRDRRLDCKMDNLSNEFIRPLIGALVKNDELTHIRFYCIEELRVRHELHKLLKRPIGRTKLAIDRKRHKIDTIAAATHVQQTDTMNSLAKAIHSSLKVSERIVSLELTGIKFTSTGIDILARGIRANHSLERLSLKQGRMGDRAIKPLLDSFQTDKIPGTLILADCNLTDYSGVHLASIIKRFVTLRSVAEWESSLRGGVVNHSQSQGLFELDISSNKLTDVSACELAAALYHDTWLSTLNLKRNKIGAEGGRIFSDLFLENASITSLNISSNRIPSATMRHLTHCVDANRERAIMQGDLNPNKVPGSLRLSGLTKVNEAGIEVPILSAKDKRLIAAARAWETPADGGKGKGKSLKKRKKKKKKAAAAKADGFDSPSSPHAAGDLQYPDDVMAAGFKAIGGRLERNYERLAASPHFKTPRRASDSGSPAMQAALVERLADERAEHLRTQAELLRQKQEIQALRKSTPAAAEKKGKDKRKSKRKKKARADDAVLASLEQAFAQFETFVSTLEQQSASAASPSGRAAVQVKAGAAQAVAAHMQDMLKAM